MTRRKNGFPFDFDFLYGYGTIGRRVRRGSRITVQPWEQGLLLRDGALVKQLGAGSVRVWRARCELRTFDTRPSIVNLPTQEIPTADGVTVKLTATVCRKIVDAATYLSGSQDADQVLYLAVQIALREVVSDTTIEQLLGGRGDLPEKLLQAVRGVEGLGLQVDAVEIKDIVLPSDLKRAQAQVLIARSEGLASLERARGETAALRALANAARLTAENPTLFQLRLLQQLASSPGHTVVIGSEPAVAPIAPASTVPPSA